LLAAWQLCRGSETEGAAFWAVSRIRGDREGEESPYVPGLPFEGRHSGLLLQVRTLPVYGDGTWSHRDSEIAGEHSAGCQRPRHTVEEQRNPKGGS